MSFGTIVARNPCLQIISILFNNTRMPENRASYVRPWLAREAEARVEGMRL
jgi:hypothetical protein